MHGLQLLHHVNARVNGCMGRSDWRLIGWPPSVSFSSSLASSQPVLCRFCLFGLLSALQQHQQAPHGTTNSFCNAVYGGIFFESCLLFIASWRIATINLLQNNISITQNSAATHAHAAHGQKLHQKLQLQQKLQLKLNLEEIVIVILTLQIAKLQIA